MARPLNILWICTDQQRQDSLGCYGNKFVRTPHIDGLAAGGLRFDNAFCNSPVCTPSRASFLTGRYPRTNRCRKNGQSLPVDETLVTQILAEAGYDCGLAGKLHLSACHPKATPHREPRLRDGYSEFNWSHHPQDDWSGNDYTQWLADRGETYRTQPVAGTRHVVTGPDAEHQQAAWCAERAIDFIQARQPGAAPWLYSVNIFAPHHPFDPPRSHLDRYLDRLKDIPLPAFTAGDIEGRTDFQRRDHAAAYGVPGLYPFPEMTDDEHRLVRAAYWAMVDLIDEQVGRLLAALDATGQRENTLVVFMSDHGELLGDHGIYLKGPHFYDAAVRVPLIFSWPGHLPAGQSSSAMVELLDLAPTFLQMAGLPVPPGMQGQVLQPLFDDPQTAHRESVFCENHDFDGPGYAMMVRDRTHKLMAYHNGEGELYALNNDPGEARNLWSEPAAAGEKSRMLGVLVDRLARTADPLPLRQGPW